MRLDPEDKVAIKAAALRTFGSGVAVYLYGSRTDDSKRGGDIDLMIETAEIERADLEHENGFRCDLERMIGERRVDVLVRHRSSPRSAIEDVAFATGVRIL